MTLRCTLVSHYDIHIQVEDSADYVPTGWRAHEGRSATSGSCKGMNTGCVVEMVDRSLPFCCVQKLMHEWHYLDARTRSDNARTTCLRWFYSQAVEDLKKVPCRAAAHRCVIISPSQSVPKQ